MISSSRDALSGQLIWATRGRAWGFRFLLDAGLTDPLIVYERAFADLQDEPSVWQRSQDQVALRFSDPSGRRDSAGRVIPHEFVLFDDLANAVDSVDAGIRVIWPLVAEIYSLSWDAEHPPDPIDLPSPRKAAAPARRDDETAAREME